MGEKEISKKVDEEQVAEAGTDEKNAINDKSAEKELALLQIKDSDSISKPAPLLTPTDSEVGETVGKPKDRDVALARVENEKKLALIKAWEDNEKIKADNKAHKKLSSIDTWENTKRASIEAQLKQIEENFEKKKAEYAEKIKNKMAMVHKAAEEKRAVIEADRGKDFVVIEETATKYRATGTVPKKLFACFSC